MCTTDTSSVFIDQYISYINTTDTSVNITCLEPNTCYILGIRAVYSGIQGEWTLLANRILTLFGNSNNDYYEIAQIICIIIIDQCITTSPTHVQSTTGLIFD